MALQSNNLNAAWRLRLFICVTLLLLAYASLMIFTLASSWFSGFCGIMAIVDAVLCILINFRRPLFRQLLHWLGTLAVVYWVMVFTHRGMFDSAYAGMFTLMILALAIYLAGLYNDILLVLVSLILAIMAFGILLFSHFLWWVVTPFTLIAIFVGARLVIKEEVKP